MQDQNTRNNRFGGKRRRSRKMFKPKPGEKWICAKCGQEIKELPFIPDPNRPVYHRECMPSKQ